MELATFGAVLSFAMDLEQRLGVLYRKLQSHAPGELSAQLGRAIEAAQKRAKLLEQVRRENVAELILEPISGFRSEDYALENASEVYASYEACKEAWRKAERTAVSFYTLGAQKLPIPEVKRVFERLAKEHERSLE
jgi:rubrerythrin